MIPNRLMSQEGFDQQQTKAPDGDQELGLTAVLNGEAV